MAAPAIVQQTSSGSGASASFASLPTVGNLIVVVGFQFATIAPAADNQGNTYTEHAEQVDANGNFVAVSSGKVVTSSGTFTISAMGGGGVFWAAEISGWSGLTVVDDVKTAAKVGTTAPWDLATAPLLCGVAEDLIVIGSIDQSGTTTFTAKVNGTAATQQFTSSLQDIDYVWTFATSARGVYNPSIRDTGTLSNTAAMVAMAIRGAGAFDGNSFGGGGFDDRKRVQRSGVFGNGTGASWTMFMSKWPESARDRGWQDQRDDNVSRLF